MDNEQAIIAALRGQQNQGNALSLSTINQVADYGIRQSKSATDELRDKAKLKQALMKEERLAEREQKKEARAFKRWEAKQDRMQEDKINFEEFKNDLVNADKETNTKIKPTGKAVQDYGKSRQLTDLITSVQADFDKLDDKQREILDNPEADVLTDLLLPASVERYAQDKFIYDDPSVKNLRAKKADIESEFSRLMSGLAVTGYEMTDRQKWSPNAVGISSANSRERLNNLLDKLKGQQTIAEQTYNLGNIADSVTSIPNDKSEVVIDTPDEEIVVEQNLGDDMTVTRAELQQMGATEEEAAAEGYKVID